MRMLENIIYRGGAETNDARVGTVRALDDAFELPYIPPVPGPWDGERGTNPEQLLAAAWSICFHGMLALALRTRDIESSSDYRVQVEVDLGKDDDGALGLAADIAVIGLGVSEEVANEVLGEAFSNCPFCQAMHNNIRVNVHTLNGGAA